MRWIEGYNSCKVTGVTTKINVMVTLPKWVHNGDADPSEKERWSRYYKNLVNHENGHKELALEAGNNIDQLIMEMNPAVNCTTLKDNAMSLGRSVVDEFNARSAKYDNETDHGRNEGSDGPMSRFSNQSESVPKFDVRDHKSE